MTTPISEEQKIKDEADFKLRQENFIKDLKLISSKYRIDVVGGVIFKDEGIFGVVRLIDVKHLYEQKATQVGDGVAVAPVGIDDRKVN